jgi:ATP-dependent RNA helicase DeaD
VAFCFKSYIVIKILGITRKVIPEFLSCVCKIFSTTQTKGDNMDRFEGLGLSENMLSVLRKKGFEEPTPIQQKIIPFLLNEKRDVLAQAQTGTGKTAAFGIPIIEQIDARSRHVKALVLVPTRELAIQAAEELSSLKGTKKLQIVPVYGGQSIGLQLKHLKQGVDIIVGTPGRTIDHLKRGSLRLDNISFLVFDEADEMLNMGFIDEINEILKFVPAVRRNMLFSATMPRPVLSIAKRYMSEYETISDNQRQQTTALTDQIYFEVHEQDKFEALCRIIDMEPDFYGLVFCRTRTDTDAIASKLISRGYEAAAIHGEINQAQREKIMRDFRGRRVNILVATDVAARGIDVSDLTHVVNFALPQDPESYVHRIGRTGRAGKEGTAITFVTPRESRPLDLIRKVSGAPIRKGRIPGVDQVIAAKKNRLKGEIETAMQSGNLEVYKTMAAELLKEADAVGVLAACLSLSFGDELDTGSYQEIHHVESVDNKGRTRLFVAKGRRQGITPGGLIKFISRHSDVNEKLIRDIQIYDDYTLVTVPFADAEVILKKSRQKKGRPMISKAKAEKRR